MLLLLDDNKIKMAKKPRKNIGKTEMNAELSDDYKKKIEENPGKNMGRNRNGFLCA